MRKLIEKSSKYDSIYDVEDDLEQKIETKDIRDAIREAECSAIVAAAQITAEQAKAIRKDLERTEDDMYSLKKYEIMKFYALANEDITLEFVKEWGWRKYGLGKTTIYLCRKFHDYMVENGRTN